MQNSKIQSQASAVQTTAQLPDSQVAPAWEFEGLEPHRAAIERYLRTKVADENDIQDLVQETWLRAARYRRPPLEGSRLRGWLVRIASNLQVDSLRRRAYEPVQGQDLDQWEAEPTGSIQESHEPEAAIACAGRWWPMDEAVAHLRSGLKRLSERDRAALTGFYDQGQGGAQLARELGVQTDLVKVRLFRARRRLRQWVELGMRAAARPDCRTA